MGTGVDGSPHSPGPRDSGDLFFPSLAKLEVFSSQLTKL